MANHAPSIIIRFLRSAGESSANTDDVLRIYKMGENTVKTIYREHTESGRGNVSVNTMNYQQLVSYLYRIFWLLGIDDDPFRSVQFFIPGYPTSLIMVETVKKNMQALFDLLMNSIWSWPRFASRPELDTFAQGLSVRDRPSQPPVQQQPPPPAQTQPPSQ
jgi:hypothetical protein